MIRGFKGVKYPFQLNNRGGIALSTTSASNFDHIEESVLQILKTNITDRVMMPYFGTSLDVHAFNQNNLSLQTMVKGDIMDALENWEPRIQVSEVSFTVTDNKLYAKLVYTVIAYALSNTQTVYLGAI